MHELQLAAQHRKPKLAALNSPWDLWIHNKNLYIAMAGPHQIWKMPLDESEIAPYAGNGREDIVDGPLLPHTPYEMGFSSFAQPSGLTSDGTWLYVADSEGSSIRAVPFDPRGKVKTIVGTAGQHQARLFTFGDIDGRGDRVRLQHPLGVAWYGDKLYVADTYNSRVKELDVNETTSTAIAGKRETGHQDAADGLQATFDEPAGISVAAGKLYLADTNNHLIRSIEIAAPHAVRTIEIPGLTAPKPVETEATPPPPANLTKLPPATLRATDGAIELAVAVELPAGWKINPLAPMRYKVEPIAKAGVVNRKAIGKFAKVEPPAPRLTVRLPVTAKTGDDLLRVTLQYYHCQEGNEGLCKASSIAWELPLKLTADAASNTTTLTVEAK
jgi:hypothetical protein